MTQSEGTNLVRANCTNITSPLTGRVYEVLFVLHEDRELVVTAELDRDVHAHNTRVRMGYE